ncbi:MAG: 30S ribosomal protein S12 methylthiotransferase RimO [Elusimicrobiaceae bacterium]|nr:30S ribosomal protein S12 methylthiotransferase RimO [Elusimicrobiaceae bacterium]
MSTVFVISLGCPKNLTDTETMLGSLLAKGHTLVQEESGADAVLLNTCAFIKPARAEAEREIRRLCALKRKGRIGKVLVAGCLVQKNGAALQAQFPDVDVFAGLGAIEKIARLLEKSQHCFGPAPATLHLPRYKAQATAPHSAYLKIADGCNNRCAYCTIPEIRGPFRSKPVEEILLEARDMALRGVTEISVIAQDTTNYGSDLYGRPALLSLLKKMTGIDGINWIRLMYVYPEKIDRALLEFMASSPKICRYLDMPLQHSADSVLKAMNRRCTGLQLADKVRLIRRLVPGIAIRTNFITGFPGETERDFNSLLEFIETNEFENVGVFTYWREPGTPAAAMKKQVPQALKQARAEALIKAQSRVVDRLNRRLLNTETDIIADTARTGRMPCDAPDIDGYVEIKTRTPLVPGRIVRVKITGAKGYARTAVLA